MGVLSLISEDCRSFLYVCFGTAATGLKDSSPVDVQSSDISKMHFSAVQPFPLRLCPQAINSLLRPNVPSPVLSTHPLVWFSLDVDCAVVHPRKSPS